MSNAASLLVTAMALTFAGTAEATQVQVSFSGIVDQVEVGSYTVGQATSGTVLYDPEAPLTSTIPSFPFITTNFSGAVSRFVLDGLTVEQMTYSMVAQTWSASNGATDVSIGMAGFDSATGLYETLDLWLHGPNLPNNVFDLVQASDFTYFTSSRFGYALQDLSIAGGLLYERFSGVVTNLAATAITTPAPVALLFTGILPLAWRRARQRLRS